MKILKLWTSKRSDHECFEVLVKPHVEQLYKLAYRLSGQGFDAEDLVQDTLLKLYPRLPELQKIEKLGPWLARVLYRHFIDKQRGVQRSPVQYTDDEHALYEDTMDDALQPMALLEYELTQECLQLALDQLNPDQRLVLLLHDVEGYTLLEIQDIQGVALGTLKSRLHRAQQKLREILVQMEPFEDVRRVNG